MADELIRCPSCDHALRLPAELADLGYQAATSRPHRLARHPCMWTVSPVPLRQGGVSLGAGVMHRAGSDLA